MASAGKSSPTPPPPDEEEKGYDSWSGWTEDEDDAAPREAGPLARAFLVAKAKKESEDKEAALRRQAERREAREAERRRLEERQAQRQREREEREKEKEKLPTRDDELERMLDMFNAADRAP